MTHALIIPQLHAAAAPARFPYPSLTMAETCSADPKAWRRANKPHFDALYGPEARNVEADGTSYASTRPHQERLTAARAWRFANKARFDAIYGPETACTCGAA